MTSIHEPAGRDAIPKSEFTDARKVPQSLSKGDRLMRVPGFTADACLGANQTPYEVDRKRHGSEFLGRGSVEPAIPGRSEQAYIDCLIDCRASGGKNCTQSCTPHSGTGSAGSSPGPSCAPGFTPCGSSCKFLAGDPSNCGVCGNSCGTGMDCCDGQCAPCCYNGGGGVKARCTDGTMTCCPTYAPFCWSLFGITGCSFIPHF